MSEYKDINLSAVRRERNIMLRLSDEEYAAIIAHKPAGTLTAVYLRERLKALADPQNVLLCFTENQMEAIQATKSLEDDLEIFIRRMVLKNLETHDIPRDLGRLVAFVVSSLDPRTSFQDALSSYNDIVVNGEIPDEVHEE